MNRLLLGTCLLAAFAVVSCDNANSKADNAPTPSAADTATLLPAVAEQPVGSIGSPSDGAPAAAPLTTPAAIPTQGAALNPPHGQPGHRCEIAVGAPLGSAPTATAPLTTINPTSAPVVTPPPALPVVTPTPAPVASPTPVGGTGTARLNPPHGQPGHTCAIPVGQPLP